MLRWLSILGFCLLVGKSFACDRSYITMDAVNFDGTNYTIDFTLGIGGGVLGAVRGADANTSNFFLAIAAMDGSFIDILSYSPTSFTSDSTSCTYPSIENNQVGNPFFAANGIFVQNVGCSLACITSTAACGYPHTQEYQIQVVVDTLPDYIQAFGIEGNGNPFAGCYLDADMTANINTFLPVEWGILDYERRDDKLLLQWSTLSEELTSHFIIEKTYDGHSFFKVGERYSHHMTSSETFYDYLVESENNDVFYRLTMIDFDASRSTSDLLFVPSRKQTEPNLFPNPGRDQLTIDLEGEWQCQMSDMQGRVVMMIEGKNRESISMKDLPQGAYMLQIIAGRQFWNERWIKKD